MQALKNKILVRLSGGLGNQLFQLSAALSLSKLIKSKAIYLDTRFLCDYETPRSFELDFLVQHIIGVDILTNQMRCEQFVSKLRISKIIDGKLFNYACLISVNSLLALRASGDQYEYKSVILDGYFQDPRVLDIEGLREIFNQVVKRERDTLLEAVNQKFLINGSPLIGVHIRRGDFIHQKAASKRFQNLDFDYYMQASKHFPSNVCFLIFGDDPKACYELATRLNGFAVESLDLTMQQEFILLSSCDGFIIANSTFSWWASNLGNMRGSTVVAPKFWYKNKFENENNQLLLKQYKFIN